MYTGKQKTNLTFASRVFFFRQPFENCTVRFAEPCRYAYIVCRWNLMTCVLIHDDLKNQTRKGISFIVFISYASSPFVVLPFVYSYTREPRRHCHPNVSYFVRIRPSIKACVETRNDEGPIPN